MGEAGPVIGDVLSVLGCLFLLVTAAGWLRSFLHRVPPAHGDPEMAAELDRMAGRRTRGLAAAVIDLDRGMQQAFIDADENTRFEIGSVTKALTGMLLAEAVHRDELTLDCTVSAVLVDTAASSLGSVTLRELCTHTSGLPRQSRSLGPPVRAAFSAWFGTGPYRGLTPAAVLRLARRQRLVRRGRQRYSNLGASVLGQVLAAAAGRDSPPLLVERIYMPVGMPATRIAERGNAASRGWTAAGRRCQPWLLRGYSPAGGAVSTLEDMTLLAVALLDGSPPSTLSMRVSAGPPVAMSATSTGRILSAPPIVALGRQPTAASPILRSLNSLDGRGRNDALPVDWCDYLEVMSLRKNRRARARHQNR